MSPDTISKILGTNKDIIVYGPPAETDTDIVIEASKRGAFGVLDLEYLDNDAILEAMPVLNGSGVKFGVRLDPMSDKLMILMAGDIPQGLKLIVSISKEGLPDMVRSGVYDTAHEMGMKIFQEVCSLEEANDSASSGADALILRSFEGGGRVSDMELSKFRSGIEGLVKDTPIVARGGFDIDDMGKDRFQGYVMDQESLGSSYLPKAVKDRMDGSSVITVMKDIGRTMRFISGDEEARRLSSIGLENEDDPKAIYKSMKSEITEMISITMKGDAMLYPAGDDAMEIGKKSFDDVLPPVSGPIEPKKASADVMVDGKPVPKNYHDSSIAIIGMGTVFPKGIGKDNFWQMVLDGVDATCEIPKERWDWKLHYDPDPSVPNKTYSKIGAFITELEFNPFDYKIPPKVAEFIDLYQKYGIVATKEALIDANLYEGGDIDRNNVGVIVSNSGGGENRDWVSTRVNFEEIHDWMKQTDIWKDIPEDARKKLYLQTRKAVNDNTIDINEDTMPGSLPNVASGRIANIFNFRGPNFITDAACASALAAVFVARNSLNLRQIDAAVSGGLDSLMASHGFVEFCKIGALTPDGSRPFSDGANGFLMGEGGGIVILKRLEDAVDAGDHIYAVIRGIGGSSDGKGKGITAPNPEGQMLSVKRGLEDARVGPETISFIEAHGTSTAVGDVAEMNALAQVFTDLPPASIGLTSVKSQIGHLKSAAGAAGMIKSALAIDNKILPPQINFDKPNHYIDWEKTPFYVITESKEWNRISPDIPRRCGVSAFGFGGTNFHVILEEFDTDIYDAWKVAKTEEVTAIPAPAEQIPVDDVKRTVDTDGIVSYLEEHGHKEGEAFIFSSDNPLDLLKQATAAFEDAKKIVADGGRLKDAWRMPSYNGRYRLGLVANDIENFEKQLGMLKKIGLNEKALMALAAKGIFVGDRERIDHGKVCLMFPGQGSQYINMFRDLKEKYTVVRETFEEADNVMKDLIDEPLSSYVFKDLDRSSPDFKKASETLRQTEFNQPSMLTVDTAMYKLITNLGIEADLVMGHSLGEYGALIASGIMKFEDALKAVSARGKEMRDLQVDDPGKMASVMAGLKEVEEVLSGIEGYVIPANKNCHVQTVIAGESGSVDEALAKFQERGIEAGHIPVSHAFHSEVVAPAKVPLRNYLSKLDFSRPKIPVLSNVTADYYPSEGTDEEIKEQVLDLLKEQVAHSVEWIGEVDRAYKDGARTFIEVGPKRALSSFAYNLMEEDVKKGKVFPITSNHPKKGGVRTYNELVASLWSLGFDLNIPEKDDASCYEKEFIEAFDPFVREEVTHREVAVEPLPITPAPKQETEPMMKTDDPGFRSFLDSNSDLISDFLKNVYERVPAGGPKKEKEREDVDLSGTGATVPTRKGVNVVISGSAIGLPGTFKKVFDPNNLGYLVEGRNLISNVDTEYLEKFIDKNIVRLDKKPDGSAEMVNLDDPSKVLHLTGKLGEFDLASEFGVPENLVEVLDITSKLAFAAGLLAIKDSGIPLVRRYSQTSTGSFLPENWELPLEMQEDTGIVFASAFPGLDNLLEEISSYFDAKMSKAVGEERRIAYEVLKERIKGTEEEAALDAWYEGVSDDETKEYHFPRMFMFKTLAMGHSQFAQYIKAKGPNTQVNSACASSSLAISIAQDWIQAGRCKRVIVIGADDPASDNNIEWYGSSLLALGALTPEEDITKAALPFDRRRKGMIIGSGVAALIVEAEEEPKRRGMNPIVEVLGTHLGNSAFHGSRLDIAHISRSMDSFITKMEREWGIDRNVFAHDLIFMSHETYTPARGGSSAAEVESLRRTFGDNFSKILIMNTKGYTGHAFGACIEDPVLVKSLQEGVAIPLANLTPDQIDPQFEGLQLSSGGKHTRHYGLRLAAGFGSQLVFILIRRTDATGRYMDEEKYKNWLGSIATTEPVELETVNNVLVLKDNGRDNLIKHRAVRRGSSAIGYKKDTVKDVESNIFDDYRAGVLEIFSDKTGFPLNTIDIDSDMEMDLGIDTVKQVELFGAARVAFGLPKDEGVNLRDYPTLRDVIHYVILKKEGERVSEEIKTSQEDKRKEKGPADVDEASAASDGKWESARDRVIAIVSEKTGYPSDMLDIDLDLESDLGIDTVKQVELFGMARNEFDLPRDDSINLQDFNTLRKIIDYVLQGSGEDEVQVEETAATIEKEDEEPATAGGWDAVKDQVIIIVAEKTGYPEDMLELDLDLEADLGIDTVKQVELFGMARDEFDLPRDDSINLQELNTLRKMIDFIYERSPGRMKDNLEEKEPEAQPSKAVEEEEKIDPIEGTTPGVSWDIVKDKVITIVAEKTGYPEDMLELDLDLEADLGIDTVKQVELFGMARGEFDLPRDDSVNLSEFPTLRHIIDYVSGKAGEVDTQVEEVREEMSAEVVTEEEPAPSSISSWDLVRNKVIPIVAEKTGYPEDMLELDLDLEADLGIDTVKQVELFGMARSEFNLPKDDSVNLSEFPTLRHIIDYVAGKAGEMEAPVEEAVSDEDSEEVPDDVEHWDTVKDKVLTIVAEKTGYPEDMLELDLDLEADLGVDTVKQVELFGMARSEFGIPRDDSIDLSKFPTLRHIIDYVTDRTKELAEVEVTPAEEKKPDLSVEDLKERINRWVLQADQMEDLEQTDILPLSDKKMLLLGGGDEAVDLLISDLGCAVDQYSPDQILASSVDMEQYDGMINLYPLEMSEKVMPDDWDKLSDRAVRTLFKIGQGLYKKLKEGGFFFSITAMGGKFGIDRDVNPMNGAVSGFTKAVHRELPKTRAMVLDVPHGSDLKTVIERLAMEIVADHRIPEIGWDGQNRYRPVLRIIEPASPSMVDIKDGMNILISGGGAGITAEIVRGLAGKASLDLHILGRTKIMEDVEKYASMDKEALDEVRDGIKQKMKDEGVKVTPVKIDKEFSKITRSVGIHGLLKDIEQAGSKGHYHSLDVTDSEGLGELAEREGPFDIIIHAAGIEVSRSMSNKKIAEFDMVFNTKVKGFKALLDATRDHPLKAFISFSSVAGRFGNSGQVDYSAANDLLDKLPGAIRSIHPDCHVKAVGWSAWADVGMASKGSVKTILEIGGVTFIQVKDGVRFALDEITSGNEKEVFYSGSMGPLDAEGSMRWEEGIMAPDPVSEVEEEATEIVEEQGSGEKLEETPEAVEEKAVEKVDGATLSETPPLEEFSDEGSGERIAPLVDMIVEKDDRRLVIKKRLDVRNELFLLDHSIMGTPVLPGVMGLEIFAETAKLLRPELDVIGLKDIGFHKAVNVPDTYEVTVSAEIEDDDDQEKTVNMKFTSIDPKKGTEITHYTGKVILGRGDDACRIQEGHPFQPNSVMARVLRGEIYDHLFHGQLFQVTAAMEILSEDQLLGVYRIPEGGQFSTSTPWKDGDLITTPMQTELGFQIAGAYTLDRFDMMALPVKIGEMNYSSMMRTDEPAFAWVRFNGRKENVFSYDIDVIDTSGNVRFHYTDFCLKGLMANKVDLIGDHAFTFEEVSSPLKEVRVFRLDSDDFDPDLEKLRPAFSDEEWDELFTDRMTDKRKREHALGRVISKLAVSWSITVERSVSIPISEIRIHIEDGGKPFAKVGDERIEISISHSHRWAVCSVSSKEHGVDIELAEPRDLSFAEEAFHPSEMDLLKRIQGQMDIGEPLAQTLLFSAKEAYLKMKGVGLKVDLKEVITGEVIKIPARTGLGFELMITHDDIDSKVEAHVASAYVLTVCSK